jgi:hypothetical protein
MSLIPSESYSFPDHFTSTVTPSRKPKEEETVKADPPRERPTIVALPDPPPPQPLPVVVKEEAEAFAEEPAIAHVPPTAVEPVRSKPAPPNPALLRATAPPPRIPDAPVRKMPFPPTLKPKVRWNHRTPAMDPAPARQNVASEPAPAAIPPPNIVPMRPKPAPARPTRPAPLAPAMREPIQTPPSPPKPVPAVQQQRPVQPKPVMQKPQPPGVPNPQGDFFEMFAETGHEAAMKRRRQMKFRRFIACEIAALAFLVPLVILGLTLDITASALRWLINIFTIAAAISAAVIPIVFYALTPTLPELER